MFFKAIPYAAFNVLPVVLIISLVIILLNISVKPVPRFLAVITLFFTAYLVFTGSLVGFGQVLAGNTFKTEQNNYFIKEQINTAGALCIYPAYTSKTSLQNTLVFDPKAADYKFSFYKELESTLVAETLIINIAGKKVSTELKNPYTRFIYQYDPFSGDILKAFAVFNHDLLAYAAKPNLIFFFSCFAFLFFIMTCGMFTRITKWPLFNLLLFAVIITLFTLLYSFYKTEVYTELVKIMQNQALLTILPLFVMTGMGILFILVDIIFIPRKYWKEGIGVD